jgi:hypothetical protein
MDEHMMSRGMMRVVTTCVPPYSLWVEGDNPTKSKDSRHDDHGPVSKKLLVGIAEYRAWPPWRIGKLNNTRSAMILPNNDQDNDDNPDASKVHIDKRSKQIRYRSRSYWPN